MSENIITIFNKISYSIDDFLKEWIEENQIENKIPNHYDNLNIYMDLKDNFFLDINFQKTNSKYTPYYDNFKSIKDAYKRVNIIIGKKNSLKAFNIHARNRLGMYELVSYDIKRMELIDEDLKASEYINSLWDIIENRKAIKSNKSFPNVFIFQKR